MRIQKLCFLVCLIIFRCVSSGWAADNPTEAKRITVSSSDAPEKVFFSFVEKILSERRAGIRECSALQSYLEVKCGDKLGAPSAAERRRAVRDALGEGRYKDLEEILLSQLTSSDAVLKNCAVCALGRTLFSEPAADSLKGMVFGPNPQNRFDALVSLVSLDVPGAAPLLSGLLLSGILTDPMAGEAVKTLLMSNRFGLAETGPSVLAANRGAMVAQALLPALRLRKDFKEIVISLFRRDIGRVANERQLSLEEHAVLALEYDLVKEIAQDYGSYAADPGVRKKFEEYAKNTTNLVLYTHPLLAFERSGRNLSYFVDMTQDKTVPKEKITVLNFIIDRIKSGNRLKPEQAQLSGTNAPARAVSSGGGTP